LINNFIKYKIIVVKYKLIVGLMIESLFIHSML